MSIITLPNGLLQLLGLVQGPPIMGTSGNDAFNGTAADEHYQGRGGNDAINGGGGRDFLDGGDGNDAINAGTGNDYVEGGKGNDAMDGDAGNDTVGYSQSLSGVTLTLGNNANANGSGSGAAQGDSFRNFENLVGSNFADTVTGNNLANILAGLGGNDHLKGMGGNDILAGGAGADILDGGTGIDTADYSTSAAPVHLVLGGGVSSGGDAAGDSFASIEKFVVTAGSDVIEGSAITTGFSVNGGGGGDSITGGYGNDQLSIGGSAALALAGFQALAEEGGVLKGQDGDDDLDGTEFDDDEDGGNGDDQLEGFGGNDTLKGGNGHDTVDGGNGNDTLDDGSGNDLVFGGNDNDLFLMGTGQNDLRGDAGNDTFAFFDDTLANGSTDPDNPTNLGSVDGGDGYNRMDLSNLSRGVVWTTNDDGRMTLTLLGSTTGLALAAVGDEFYQDEYFNINQNINTPQDDQFIGNSEANDVFGNAGNDTLNGNGGDDKLDGGDGDDTLIGGAGTDMLTGGEGADRFKFNFDPDSVDTIFDDISGIVDLSAIDGDLTQDGHQTLIVEPDGGQVVVENGLITITLITGEASAFADEGSFMQINQNGASFSLANIEVI